MSSIQVPIQTSNNLILPHPIVRRVRAVNPGNQNIPGEIVLTQQNKLVRSYMEYAGFVGDLIETYDNWATRSLPRQVQSRIISCPDGTFARVRSLNPSNPSITEENGRTIPLTPELARQHSVTYDATLYADWDHIAIDPVTGEETVLEQLNNVYIGKIPVMLGSVWCNLRQDTDQDLLQKGECISDPFGYFVIKGTEKVILIQEKLRLNRFLLFMDPKIGGGGPVCRMTCPLTRGTSIVTLYRDTDGAIEIILSLLGKTNDKWNSIPVLWVFKLLGEVYPELEILDPQRILDLILQYIPREFQKKIWFILQPTFIKFASVGNIFEEIAKIRDERGEVVESKINNREVRRLSTAQMQKILDTLVDQLFPHIPKDQIGNKIQQLSLMIAEYAMFMIGERKLHDRDSWSNKRLETAGRSVEQLFGGLWNRFCTEAENGLASEKGKITMETITRKFNLNVLGVELETSFDSNNWGIRGSRMKENITDILKRDSILALYSHLTRINTPTNRRAKQPNIRKVQMSQLGYVCPIETPEGDTCKISHTPVMMADGTWKQIGQLTDQDIVMTVDPSTLERTPSRITRCFTISTKDYGKQTFTLKTLSQRDCVATTDHPFLTQDGWIYLENLDQEHHLLAIQPTPAPLDHQVESKVLFDKHNVRHILEQRGVKESLINKHIVDLEEIGILPLTSDSPKMPILARLCGFVLADGSIGVYNSVPSISFCCGLEYDAQKINEDLTLLGYHNNPARYTENTMTYSYDQRSTTHHTWNLSYGGALASLFLLLGMPNGKKTRTSYSVPDWVMNGSMLVQREFVAGFQGGDGCKLQSNKRHNKVTAQKYNLPRTIQHKSTEHLASGIQFMEQIAELLRRQGVEITNIKTEEVADDLHSISMYFGCSEKNIVRYMDNVGYRYATTKNTDSIVISEYLRYKQAKIEDHKKLKEDVMSLSEQGLKPTAIAKQLNKTYRQIASILEYYRENPESVSLPPKNMLSFEKWMKKVVAKNDTIFVPIESIVPHEDCMVSDFTTEHENHSMISANFVTHNCGLVKAKSVGCYVSIERDPAVIYEYIQDYLANVSDPSRQHVCLLNGRWVGWCSGEQLRDELLRLRRTGAIFRDTTFVIENNILYVNCDSSRPTRPLLIVDKDGRLLIQKKNLWGASFEKLLQEGVVEYIDAYEQEESLVAQNIDAIDARRREIAEAKIRLNESRRLVTRIQNALEAQDISVLPNMVKIDLEGTIYFDTIDMEDTTVVPRDQLSDEQIQELYRITLNRAINDRDMVEDALSRMLSKSQYTHCELDPSAIFGIAASAIPLPDHNQAPRNVYQCAMSKQALGLLHSNIHLKFDTTAKSLAYPTRPLFETQISSMIGTTELPAGDTVVVAIMTYGGYNQEDAIIFNKASVERGLFHMVIYRSYKSSEVKKSNINETFGRPPLKPKDDPKKYEHLDENGIAKIGSKIVQGQVLIGKIRKNLTTGAETYPNVVAGLGEEGYVDAILVTTNAQGMKMVKVKIRQDRKPVVGDKFASRYAQKGTIGLIMPEEDMPFARGIRPDIIINPHSIPSRMTIGKLMEIVTSKTAAFKGERVNAGAFNSFNIDEFTRQLHEYGYQRHGNEKLTSGLTGKPIQAMIFMGPCYYQALRHHVKDKIQMRQKGAIKPFTRQPVRGRSKQGGLRFGEMERYGTRCYASRG